MNFASVLARAVREIFLQPEFIARDTGRIFWAKKEADADYTTFVAEHPAYADGVPAVYADLQDALDACRKNDVVKVFHGGWLGNYKTPLNAVAPFCSIIGIDDTERGIGPWFDATVSTSPSLEIRARGWRVSNLGFEGMTGSSGIRVTKTVDQTSRCDFFKIDHCLFSGGKMGVEFYGGGTYWEISDCHFSLLTTAGGAAIYVTDSSFQIPALGLIKNNRFDNNINHIDVNGKGFSDTVIQGNNFQQDGVAQNATILIDLIGGAAGGNSVIGNFFDIPLAEFNTGGTQRIFSNATDYGAGNWFSDGAQAATMRQ